MLEAIGGGAASSWQLLNLGPKMIAGDFRPGFKVWHQQKDLRLALEVARDNALPLPATALVASSSPRCGPTAETRARRRWSRRWRSSATSRWGSKAGDRPCDKVSDKLFKPLYGGRSRIYFVEVCGDKRRDKVGPVSDRSLPLIHMKLTSNIIVL